MTNTPEFRPIRPSTLEPEKMNKVIRLEYLLIMLAGLGAPTLVSAASLLEIYQQALQSDPLIHEAEARRLAALEAAPQARSAALWRELRGDRAGGRR